MTKTVARKWNGRPETMLVSDVQADKMISKGWVLVGDDKPEPVEAIIEEPAAYVGKKRGRKPKQMDN